MDHSTQWLRREIARYLARRLGFEFVVVALVVDAGMLLSGQSTFTSAAFSIALAQVVVSVRFVMGLLSNPLNQQAVSEIIENPIELSGRAPELDALGRTGVELGLLGFHPIVAVVRTGDPTDAAPLYDLLQSRDARTTAALGRGTSTFALMSRLADGRIVVTSDLTIPPTSTLIVNVVGSVALDAAHRSHQHLLNGLERNGFHLRPTVPVVLSDLLAIEHESYRALGPFYAPFLAMDQTRRPLRLALRLTPGTILGRSSSVKTTSAHGNSGTPGSRITAASSANDNQPKELLKIS